PDHFRTLHPPQVIQLGLEPVVALPGDQGGAFFRGRTPAGHSVRAFSRGGDANACEDAAGRRGAQRRRPRMPPRIPRTIWLPIWPPYFRPVLPATLSPMLLPTLRPIEPPTLRVVCLATDSTTPWRRPSPNRNSRTRWPKPPSVRAAGASCGTAAAARAASISAADSRLTAVS